MSLCGVLLVKKSGPNSFPAFGRVLNWVSVWFWSLFRCVRNLLWGGTLVLIAQRCFVKICNLWLHFYVKSASFCFIPFHSWSSICWEQFRLIFQSGQGGPLNLQGLALGGGQGAIEQVTLLLSTCLSVFSVCLSWSIGNIDLLHCLPIFFLEIFIYWLSSFGPTPFLFKSLFTCKLSEEAGNSFKWHVTVQIS